MNQIARDLSTRIEKLNKEQTEIFEQRVDKAEDELREVLKERDENGIENTIFTDLEEIDDFNVIISAFEQSEIDYQFIRTEPLYRVRKEPGYPCGSSIRVLPYSLSASARS